MSAHGNIKGEGREMSFLTTDYYSCFSIFKYPNEENKK